MIGNRYYVKAIATLFCNGQTANAEAYAREPEERKGMDAAQVTGATSSYARKYALNGLFAIDDARDPDSHETGASSPAVASEKPTSVAAVKAAIAPKPVVPGLPVQPVLEFNGEYISHEEKKGISQKTNKPYTVTEYIVDSALHGQIKVSVFGSAIEANLGDHLTFFEFKIGEFKGAKQYSAKSIKNNTTPANPEDIAWGE
jgi:hypothetical protein